jgi:predicted DNA-binding transcriptional regulator AlpA
MRLMKRFLPPFLSLVDVCRLTKKSPVTIWRWVQKGAFPPAIHHLQTGTRLGWSRRDLRAWRAWQHRAAR